MKTAGATQHAARMRRIPVWSLDDSEIRKLVQRCFPARSQRRAAGRMMRVIYLYYRVGSTAGSVAEELKISINAVKEILKRANRTMNTPAKRRGRPKNNADPIDTTGGTSGEDHITL